MANRTTQATIDHDEIRRWAEERGGKPSVVKGTSIIRLDFPGFSGEGKLQPISWDDWFASFDESNLALVYQEATARGKTSSFNKLVGRETIDLETGERTATPRRRAKQSSRRAGAKRSGRPAGAKRIGTRAGGAKRSATAASARGRGAAASKRTARATTARKTPSAGAKARTGSKPKRARAKPAAGAKRSAAPRKSRARA